MSTAGRISPPRADEAATAPGETHHAWLVGEISSHKRARACAELHARPPVHGVPTTRPRRSVRDVTAGTCRPARWQVRTNRSSDRPATRAPPPGHALTLPS